MQLTTIDTELTALPESKAKQIKSTFEPMVAMLTEFETRYDEVMKFDEITPDVCAQAKRLRLDIGKVRIETGKLKDKAKEYVKLEDKAIMGTHNIIVWAVKEKEDKLKEVETHFERIEAERIAQLQIERVELLAPYVEDAEQRDLASMDAEAFTFLLEGKKKQLQDRIEAEKKAEAERIAKEKADAEERERIRKENERLKAEAEAKEKALAIERAKVEAERKAMEDKARKEREKAEAVAKAQLEAERAERAKVEAELKARADAEAKVEAERKASEQAEAKRVAQLAKAPVKKQLMQWVNSFELPKTTVNHKTADEINAKFNAFKSWAKTQIEAI